MEIIVNGELTPAEKTELTWKLIEQGKEAVRTSTQGYMKLGLILEMLLGKGGLWKHYASHIKTKDEFVKDAFCIGLSEASHIRRCSKKYAAMIGERAIPFNRLLSACPVVNEGNVEEILNQAEALPQSEWQNTIRILKGKLDRDICSHESVELWERCKNPECQKWLKKL